MNIFIAGLNYNMSEAELGELFAEYGEVVSVKIIMDRETGRSKGYGFVEMADDEAGDKAIAALNEVDMVLLKWLMMKLEIKRLQLLMKLIWMEKLFLCQ